ncbi:hypothetical protein G4G28_15405 [Massilia sp. Dwa41.01b]|uniref:hypothetical protein n=1 Tax=Massilia sp. Dwa41.01b TaxID=2709302 RepID=UPI001604528D|nr:hypothetical protein [Massilia sp. Dwa41.01b]QNA89509.1 hypothetical protein G4G28_15405 [Massilia sp. Dwa41.01b]
MAKRFARHAGLAGSQLADVAQLQFGALDNVAVDGNEPLQAQRDREAVGGDEAAARFVERGRVDGVGGGEERGRRIRACAAGIVPPGGKSRTDSVKACRMVVP